MSRRATAALAANGAERPDNDAKRYGLLITGDSSLRFRMRLTDEGISPGADRLGFMREGEWMSWPYADIGSVTLSSNGVNGSNLIGRCVVEFRDGTRLSVTNAGERGLARADRVPEYRTFVRDLHQRLISSGAAKHIVFRSGHSPARRNVLIAAIVAGTALFIALPVVLLLLTGKLQMLTALAGGLLLLQPACQVVGPNRPGIYSPSDPPEFLP